MMLQQALASIAELSLILPYLLFAGSLLGMLMMYFSLKTNLTRQAQRHRRMEAMLARLKDASRSAPPSPSRNPDAEIAAIPVPTVLRSGMNLSKRAQALRLLRRGEDHSHVAAALGVPRCEIDLLERVHKLTLAAASGQGGRDAAVG